MHRNTTRSADDLRAARVQQKVDLCVCCGARMDHGQEAKYTDHLGFVWHRHCREAIKKSSHDRQGPKVFQHLA